MSRLLLFGSFVILVLLTLFVNKVKFTKGLKWGILIFMILLVIFRPDTMPDYQEYITAYQIKTERFEPFYQLLYNVLHFLAQPYIVFFIIMACLTVGLKWYAIIKISNFPFLSLLVWISQILIIQDMIAVRAALAASILLWILWFKYKQKSLWMWLSIFSAIVCHYSALLFLIIPFLSVEKSRKVLYLCLLGASAYLAVLGFSITDFFNFIAIEAVENLNDVYQGQHEANAFNMSQVLRCVICVVLWLKIDYLRSIKNILPIYLKIYTLGCIIFFLSWKLVSVAFRLGELCWVSEIILYPYLMYICGRKYHKVFKLLPIGLATFLFLFNFTSPSYWNSL